MVRRGRASVVICSTAFSTLGRAQAAAMGEPGLPIAVIPHPFGSLSHEEVRRIALGCVDQVAQLATGAGAFPAGAVAAANSVADEGERGRTARTAGEPQRARHIEAAADLDGINEAYRE